MIFYHGTTETAGVSILNDKCIKTTGSVGVPVKYDLRVGASQHGYVYLTNKLYVAVYHAKTLAPLSSTLYVFKMDVQPDELLPDTHEIQIMLGESFDENHSYSLDESLAIAESAKVSRNLHFGTDIIAYTTYPLRSQDPLLKEVTLKAAKGNQPDISEMIFNWQPLI
jgi:hypothetical protein